MLEGIDSNGNLVQTVIIRYPVIVEACNYNFSLDIKNEQFKFEPFPNGLVIILYELGHAINS